MENSTKKGNLYVMSGLPGSGKTTFAKMKAQRMIENDIPAVVLSSDDIREELYGDASIVGNGDVVFGLLTQRVEEALSNGVTVFYDATNCYKKSRKPILEHFRPFANEIYGVGMNVNLGIVKERNKTRERIVPESVIDRMNRNANLPTIAEGFDAIYIVDKNQKVTFVGPAEV